jgi:hypothetical protein
MKMYCIYDSKAETYRYPAPSMNDETLRREALLLLEQDPMINAHAEDFSIFRIGVFDEARGYIELETHPIHVLNFHELQAAQEPEKKLTPFKTLQGGE